MIHHFRYWYHVALRLCRIRPFGRRAVYYKTIDEIMADYARDPEMRQLLKDARAEVIKSLRGSA